jgi:hypothetical protein
MYAITFFTNYSMRLEQFMDEYETVIDCTALIREYEWSPNRARWKENGKVNCHLHSNTEVVKP